MIKINIKGAIISNDSAWIYDWLGMDYCCPSSVTNALNNANGDDVCIEINSFGGACAAAFEIYTLLKQYDGKVTANIIFACSAATIIACGASEAYASDASIFMIHNSQSYAEGDYRNLQAGADSLREINESIINVYEGKTGLSRQELQEMMDNDTFMSPQKAIEKGFIDGMMFNDKNEPVKNICASATGMFNGLIPDIKEDKIHMLKSFLMSANMPNDNKNDNKNDSKKDISTIKRSEDKMTLQEAIEANPELKAELDKQLEDAKNTGRINEQKRLKNIDIIAANIPAEMLNDAKYGDKPLDAQALAYQVMLAEKEKASTYMKDAINDTKDAGVDNVGSFPDNALDNIESDELAAYANKRKVVK